MDSDIFFPNARLEEVTVKLKELESEFWNAKCQFMDHYASHRDDALREWERAAGKVTALVNPFMIAIESSFPLPHALEKQFGFTWTLFQISLPESCGVDAVETVAAALGIQRSTSSRRKNNALKPSSKQSLRT